MEWNKPEFIEIDMNAEIGAYQQEPGDSGDPDRVAPDALMKVDQAQLASPASARS